MNAASFQILVPEVPVLLGCSITASLVRLCTPNASHIHYQKEAGIYEVYTHMYMGMYTVEWLPKHRVHQSMVQ